VPHLRRTRTARLVRSAALTIFLALIMADAVVGDPAPQPWHFYKQPLSHEVRCFLSVDAAVWKRNGPAMVHIQLENLTDKDLDLAITPSLYLTNAEEDTYWSPVDFLRNRAFDIQRKQAPLKMHLDKQSSSYFKVDAANTKWAKEISCCWPSQSLGTVPPSRYSLRLELSDTAGNLVRSNEVTVLLEGRSDSEKSEVGNAGPVLSVSCPSQSHPAAAQNHLSEFRQL
jgi:hypothetical protein